MVSESLQGVISDGFYFPGPPFPHEVRERFTKVLGIWMLTMTRNDRADGTGMHMFNDLQCSLENLFIADVTIRNCPYAYYLHWKIERSNMNQGSDETLCEMGRGRGIMLGVLHLNYLSILASFTSHSKKA